MDVIFLSLLLCADFIGTNGSFFCFDEDAFFRNRFVSFVLSFPLRRYVDTRN